MRISDWSSDVCSSDLQFVALAVPQPDRRQRDAVEAIGLDPRIMRLVEEGETLPDAGVAGQSVVADHVAGEERGAAEAGYRPARFFPKHNGARSDERRVGKVLVGTLGARRLMYSKTKKQHIYARPTN